MKRTVIALLSIILVVFSFASCRQNVVLPYDPTPDNPDVPVTPEPTPDPSAIEVDSYLYLMAALEDPEIKTIKLGIDLKLTAEEASSLSFSRAGVVFDGNDHVITITSGTVPASAAPVHLIDINGAGITFRNVAIEVTDEDICSWLINVNADSFTYDGGSITGKVNSNNSASTINMAINLAAGTTGTRIKNVTFIETYSPVYAASADFTIEDVIFDHGMEFENYSDAINISGCKGIEGTAYPAEFHFHQTIPADKAMEISEENNGCPVKINSNDPEALRYNSEGVVIKTLDEFKTLVTSTDDIGTAVANVLIGEDEAFAVDSSIAFARSGITIYGNGADVEIKASTGEALKLESTGVKLDGFDFIITPDTSDGSVNMNVIALRGSENSVVDCTFTGSYENGDSGVTRGLGINGNDFHVEGCIFTNVRQPAYIDGITGTLRGNTISGTRGWVIASIADLEIEGNVFEGWNAEDIAIIEGNPASPDADPSHFSQQECLDIAEVNNNCGIQQQVQGFRVIDGEIYADIKDEASLRAFLKSDSEFDKAALLSNITVGNGVLEYANEDSSIIGFTDEAMLTLTGTADEKHGQSLLRIIADDVTLQGFTVAYGGNTELSSLNILKVSDNGTLDEVKNIKLIDMVFETENSTGSVKTCGLNFHGTQNGLIQNVTVGNSNKVNLSIANSTGLVVDELSCRTGAWGNVGIMYADNGSYSPSEVSFRGCDELMVYAENTDGETLGHTITGLSATPVTSEGVTVWASPN